MIRLDILSIMCFFLGVYVFLKVNKESLLERERVLVLNDVIANFESAINSKTLQGKAKVMNVYYSYGSRITTDIREQKIASPSYVLSSFLMSTFLITLTEANTLTQLLNTFIVRDYNRKLLYRKGHLNFNKYPKSTHQLFINTTVKEEDTNNDIPACLINHGYFRDVIKSFLMKINNVSPTTYSKRGKLPVSKPTISISVRDLMKMSTVSQLRILSHTVNVKRMVLNVALNIQKDIGNLGREYHLLTSIPRVDRAKISNLYGYDFESALQVIVLAILKEVKPNLALPITSHFVKNKKEVRQHVVDTLAVPMDIAKKVITASYQGGGLKGVPNLIGIKKLSENQKFGMEKLYIETKLVINELLEISSFSFKAPDSVLGKHFKAARWYASKRTVKKYELLHDDFTLELYEKFIKKYGTKKAFNFAKSYMFYLWTYFEGEARKILSSHLKQPITLHDAVYTQDKGSFDQVLLDSIEKEIFNKIGIPLKLAKA